MIAAWMTLGWLSLMYCLPFLVAECRQHPRGGAILAVNLLAGWTGIGWIVAMIWAMGDDELSDTDPVPALPLAEPTSVRRRMRGRRAGFGGSAR